MSAARVMQLVRCHYRRDDMGFASAASALARDAKAPIVKSQIQELIRSGYQGRGPVTNPTGFVGDKYTAPEAPPKPSTPAPTPAAPATSALMALPRITFEDLLIDTGTQLELDNAVTELEYQKELAARGLRARNRFLFHGPPGNGKTSVSAALAHALGADAFCVSIAELVDKHVGGTGQRLGQLFAAIRPSSVVVFDEIDAIGQSRVAMSGSQEYSATVNTLLQLMDHHKRGVIIATTNRVDVLDSALRRRFDDEIYFPDPTPEQIESLSTKLSEKFGVPFVDASDCRNFDEVTKRVEREARRIVMRELIEADSANDDTPDDLTTH